MENYKQQIKEIFINLPMHFIMYQPGSGGEFLTGLISKYSNRYYPTKVVQVEANRWQLKTKSHLFQKIVDTAQRHPYDCLSVDDLIDKTFETLLQNNISPHNEIEEVQSLINNHDKINLFRLHQSFNEFFTKENTFLLKLDARWLTYSLNLSFIKIQQKEFVKFTKEFDDEIEKNIKLVPGTINNLLDMVKFLKTSDIQSVSFAKIAVARQSKSMIKILDMDKFLRLSPADVYREYAKKYMPYPKNGQSLFLRDIEKLSNTTTVIDYNKMFTKGYLEEMFDIQGDEFHNELIRWHEDNLKLMKEFRIDWE